MRFLLITLCFLFYTQVEAQRTVVVKRPGRTVVRTTGPKVIYRRPVARVRVVHTLPRGTVVVSHGPYSYHYIGGIYYRPYNGVYRIVPAPIGLRVTVLPLGYRIIRVAGVSYYFYHGTFYKKKAETYVVVNAPLHAVVTTLPDETDTIEIDGKTYFEFNNVLYISIETPDGQAYKVTGTLETD
ncbi:DUF6515 family protein [Sediminicola luteus]|uniref:Uncharacterized protein n=1 Tax=Sediminicola luteus TaxID=319238 RepID=A0A2A4G5L5_9FLAO|nr:DUF6515 family protein [Sediminicola luteus]PCE63711.1 hypothetical protein B7P33_10570 [Sediminicola luteus]